MQIINAYFIRGPPSLCPPWGSQGPAKSKLGSGGEGDSEDLNSLAPLARFTQVSETPWAFSFAPLIHFISGGWRS
jgi:hypothetical protein